MNAHVKALKRQILFFICLVSLATTMFVLILLTQQPHTGLTITSLIILAASIIFDIVMIVSLETRANLIMGVNDLNESEFTVFLARTKQFKELPNDRQLLDIVNAIRRTRNASH